MSDDEIIHCRDCGFAGEYDGRYVCKVFEASGWFDVPGDGYCHRAVPNRRCGMCRNFRYFDHTGITGKYWDGICCADNECAAEADSFDNVRCPFFDKRDEN